MGERERESGEEAIDESGRNLTQQRIDEDETPDAPLDVEWDEGAGGGTGSDDGGPGSQNM